MFYVYTYVLYSYTSLMVLSVTFGTICVWIVPDRLINSNKCYIVGILIFSWLVCWGLFRFGAGMRWQTNWPCFWKKKKKTTTIFFTYFFFPLLERTVQLPKWIIIEKLKNLKFVLNESITFSRLCVKYTMLVGLIFLFFVFFRQNYWGLVTHAPT